MVKTKPPSDDDVLLPEEVAEMLRVPVESLTPRPGRPIDSGPPSFRIGSEVRYLRGDVRKFLETGVTVRRHDDDALPAEVVADMLGVPLPTLVAWRYRRRRDGSKQGPEWFHIEGGRVRYRREAVRAYLAKQASSE